RFNGRLRSIYGLRHKLSAGQIGWDRRRSKILKSRVIRGGLKDCLASIEHFALHFGAARPLRMVNVLESFIRQTGPGYFQVELKRAWHRLREGKSNAA
ncbi:MAG: hypothetical protein ABI476_09670, partial [Oxalobacteraceae bacterium]